MGTTAQPYVGGAGASAGPAVAGPGRVESAGGGDIVEVVPDSQDVAHQNLISQAVKQRHDLWTGELDREESRLGLYKGPGASLPEARKAKYLKSNRDNVRNIRWAMHISGVSDERTWLRLSKIEELKLEGMDEDAVSAELKKLESAFEAVGFVCLENRLQVVDEQYPKEPNLEYYNMKSEQKARVGQSGWDAAVRNACKYSKALRDWTNKHGRLFLDPENPYTVPEYPNRPPPGVYMKDFKSTWFVNLTGAGRTSVKAQEASPPYVVLKPDQSLKPQMFSGAHPSRRTLFSYRCDVCGEMANGPHESVVEIQSPQALPITKWVTCKVYRHAQCVSGTASVKVAAGSADSSSSAAALPVTSTKPKLTSECFLPVCEKCGDKITETDDSEDLVKIRVPRIAPGGVVTLQSDQLRLAKSKRDALMDQMRRAEKTVYFHAFCSPGFIGFCTKCSKPLFDETQVVRFNETFMFHRDCLPQSGSSRHD
jgi:hypothetical protein